MKLWEILRFEVAYQSRRVSTWLYFAVLLAFTFQLTLEAYPEKARTGGYFLNSPYLIAEVTLVVGVLWLLLATGIAGDAGGRDVQTRMHPLVYTTPVGRAAYLRGRFLAAFLLNALLLLAVPLGFLAASLWPAVDPELIGPLQPAAYLGAYLLFALPNAFVATAILFSLAALSRRAVAGYFGSVLLLLLAVLSWQLLAGRWGAWELAKLTDPLGLTIMGEMVLATTPMEKNSARVLLDASLLANRAVWLALALGVLALTQLRFRFAHPLGRAPWKRGGDGMAADLPARDAAAARRAPVAARRVRGRFGFATHARQSLAVAGESLRAIVGGWGGLVIAGLAALLLLTAPLVMEFMGVPLLPTTGQLIDFLAVPLTSPGDVFWMMVPLTIAFYAGELVWREREAGLGDIADASPVPDWVPLAGKFLGLGLFLVALQVALAAAAMLVQLRLGYRDFEVGLYARVLLGLQLADYLLFALLAFVVHVVVDQKYVGHMVVLAAFALMAFAPALGVEDNLLVYGSDPGWSYSDLRGFEPFVAGWLGFKAYWAAWALLLAVLARLLGARGRGSGLGPRFRLARGRLTRPVALAAGSAAGLVLALGGLVFHNTHVLNEHRTAAEGLERRAEYERRFARYQGVPQPVLTGVGLRAEIFPDRREARIRGSYRLVNRSAVAIDSVHLATREEVETADVGFDRPAARVLADEALGHRIYVLARPLQPGDSLRLAFQVRFRPRGFPNRGADASVVSNGTFLTVQEWLPAIGYQPDRELSSAGERRAHGLAPRPAVRSLDDAGARLDANGQRARIAFEAVVATDSGQVAVAPGRLLRSWTERGRSYFHYAADAPIRYDVALFSAAYAVRRDRWTGGPPGEEREVTIEVLHHPGHDRNVERMVRSVRASLDHFTARFGPYPHGQIRLVERPGPGNTLHAAPVNVWYQEDFSHFDPEPGGHDFPFAVVAHEVAHQWWGNQVIPARVEGGALLSESLAWFSAMGVVEEAYGPEPLRRLLDELRRAYLTPRTRADVPLLRASDRFLAYRKGPFAMYALREYLGEERVNGALRRLVEKHGSGAPPLATSLDLYRELRAVTPDSLVSLLHDLFEANTFWELEAERAEAAPAGGGAWQVTLDVRARKVVVDTLGVETEAPMDDRVEVGVFADAEDGVPGPPLYLGMHRIRAGEQRITVMVDRKPARAGIDPRNLLIDVEPGDNLVDVVERKGPRTKRPE